MLYIRKRKTPAYIKQEAHECNVHIIRYLRKNTEETKTKSPC